MKRIIISFIFLLLLTSCNEEISNDLKEQPNNIRTDASLTVHFIDVDQGSATLFVHKDDEEEYVMLYDVGDWQRNDIVPYLEEQNIQKIDLIIVSHPHADHIGQLDNVLQHYKVDEIWMSGNSSDSEVFIHAMEAILNSDANYVEPRAGDTFQIGNMKVEVIHPEKLTGDLNEDSISVRVTFGEISFIFTGDASRSEELQMIERTNDIQAQVLQLGHHGSNTSSDPEFIRTVNPEVAIYSAGLDNSYGHPHDEVINLLKTENIKVYGTDMDGSVVIQTDGADYDITTTGKNVIDERPVEQESVQDCIDINHASEVELLEITHIGEVRAKELVELRPFHSVDELIEINGIGPSKLNDIKEEGKACVGGGQ